VGRSKSSKPDFNHKSWDATAWSLWGLLYQGAASDREMQLGISEQFRRARSAQGSLGRQVEPMRTRVAEWREELDGFARTITFGEAQDVLNRLIVIANALEQHLEADRLLVRARKKPPPPDDSDDDEDSDDDGDTAGAQWVERYRNTVMGHSKATAKEPPRKVKARPYKPPTAAENWTSEQRRMAGDCDNGIGYGSHTVNQSAVLTRLDPGNPPGSAEQYRPGPENSHVRIIMARSEQYWTLGLSHREKRDAGNFSVYRRDGQSNRFIFVSGKRHPKDPNG
jgi:hypothetical protein